jgi:hypothetical protein
MATDSRVDSWTPATALAGDELIPAQNAAVVETSVTPAVIATYVAQNPLYYGVAALEPPIAAQTLTANTTEQILFPTLQLSNIGAAWSGNGTFTVPAGKGGMWMANLVWAIDNVAVAGNPEFALATKILKNGNAVGSAQLTLRESDFAELVQVDLEMTPILLAAPGDVFEAFVTSTADVDMSYDLLAAVIRWVYLGS